MSASDSLSIEEVFCSKEHHGKKPKKSKKSKKKEKDEALESERLLVEEQILRKNKKKKKKRIKPDSSCETDGKNIVETVVSAKEKKKRKRSNEDGDDDTKPRKKKKTKVADCETDFANVDFEEKNIGISHKVKKKKKKRGESTLHKKRANHLKNERKSSREEDISISSGFLKRKKTNKKISEDADVDSSSHSAVLDDVGELDFTEEVDRAADLNPAWPTSAQNDDNLVPQDKHLVLENDDLYINSWNTAQGKSDTSIKAFLANARLKISKTKKSEKITNLRGEEVTDYRNLQFDDNPMTSALWARHNRGRFTSIVVKLNEKSTAGLTFTLEEANDVMDYLMAHRESVGGHPYHFSITIPSKFHFAFDRNFLSALKSRGFDLRFGFFTKREDKILTENTELFLSSHGISSSNRAKIDEIFFSDHCNEFRKETGFLVFAAHRLPRTSDQVYARLKALYHKGNYKGRYSAAEIQRLVDFYKEVKSSGRTITRGHRGEFKQMEEPMGRFRIALNMKYHQIRRAMEGDQVNIGRTVVNAIFAAIATVTGTTDLASLSNIPWDEVVQELVEQNQPEAKSLTAAWLKSFWERDGLRRFRLRVRKKWTGNDWWKLVREMEEQQIGNRYVDEFNINWDNLLTKFDNVVDVKHLRKQWLRLRRCIPFYMLKDLGASLHYLKKEILPNRYVEDHLAC